MDFGVSYFPTDKAIAPAELARCSRSAGSSRSSSPSTPTSRPRATRPTRRAATCPEEYWRTHDPFVALMSAAAATEKIKIGTAICLLVERDPIVTAKAAASVDALSGGRLLFGVGAGWNREEMANHGTDPSRRFSLLRERVEAVRAIWTEDEATYQGEFVEFDRIWCWPKPVQPGGPPDPARRQRAQGPRPRARLRRRVVPQPHRSRGAQHPPDRRTRAPSRRGRPRPDPGHAPDPAAGRRVDEALRRGRRHAHSSSCCAPRTRSTSLPPRASSTSGASGCRRSKAAEPT